MSDDIDPIDLLAGEYALGLLEGGERAAAALRAETDPEFRERVEFWETRLASLLETLEERPAPAATKARIEAAIFGHARTRPKAASSLWQSLALWRTLTTVGFATAALVIVSVDSGILSLGQPEIVERIEIVEVEVPAEVAPAAGLFLVAALQPVEVDPVILAVFNESDSLLTLAGSIGTAQPGDAELWIIPEGGVPISLGLIARDGTRTLTVSETLAAEFRAGSALAVSLEPEGGSPTGAPTGPILALAPLTRA